MLDTRFPQCLAGPLGWTGEHDDLRVILVLSAEHGVKELPQGRRRRVKTHLGRNHFQLQLLAFEVYSSNSDPTQAELISKTHKFGASSLTTPPINL